MREKPGIGKGPAAADPPAELPFAVVYEDNHLLVVAKPAGIPVQADRSGDPSLQARCKAWIARRHRKAGNVYLGIVHRLDRPVAGVVLFARTSKAASRLSAQFRGRTVRKVYLAVVEGVVEAREATLTGALRWDGRHARPGPPDLAGGRAAELTYRVRETGCDKTLLEVEPATGRKHQIRAQLADAGHPILGDLRYGARRALPDRSIALLAWRLTITHPTRREALTFTCPPPPAWPWP